MKVKSFFVTLSIIICLFVFPQTSSAQMMGKYYNNDTASPSSQNQTGQQSQQHVQNLISDVLRLQKISSVNQIDCKEVSNDQFEKIGDAWMDVRIGNESVHSRMDQMMGGEGSESLREAHRQMGENYLGCPLTGNQTGFLPMMFGLQNAVRGGVFPMMGWGGYGNMMNGNFGWGFGLVGLLFWLIVFFDLILLGIFLWQKIKK